MKYFWMMTMRSMKRRKRELRYVAAATCIAALFLSGLGLFQRVMNNYVREVNKLNYGNWVLSSVEDYQDPEAVFQKIEHPYLGEEGNCTTGLELLKENMEGTGFFPGTADETFRKIGNISFYEGRWPENEKEVVMDLPSLAALGYSYEIGQTIHLAVSDDGQLREEDYILTGTIKSIASNWSYIPYYPLPAAFFTEEGFERLTSYCITTHFYSLNEQYKDIDVYAFAEPFLEDQTTVQLNRLAYGDQVWESPEMFAASEWILLCIAMLAVGCLFMSYVSGRRSWLYKLRGFGASKGQIRRMILLEGLCTTVPWAVFGIGLPYAAAFFICLFVSKTGGLPNFFTFSMSLFLQQAGGIFGVILFGIVCAWITVRDKNLAGYTKEVSERQRNRVRKKAEKKISAFLLWKRQKGLHPYRRIVDILFSVIVCSLLLVCVDQLSMAWKEFHFVKDDISDVIASKKVFREGENGKVSWSSDEYDMYQGMPEEFRAKIKALVGIQTMKEMICDQSHQLVWDDMKDSPVRKAIIGDAQGGMPPLESSNWTLFRFTDTLDGILRSQEPLKKSKVFSREAFDQGEQIIFIPGQYMNSAYMGVYEDTIREGDTIWIESDAFHSKIQVEVGAVLEWKNDLTFGNRPYGVLGSLKLAQKIAETEQQSLQYNSVQIDFNRHASFESTEKQLATLFAKQKMDYESNREYLTMMKNRFLNSVGVYGTLFAAILAVYIMLQMNFQLTGNYYLRERYLLLNRLGMEDSVFCVLSVRDMARQTLWILMGLPASYGIVYWKSYTAYRRERVMVYSEFLGKFTDNLYWQALMDLKYSTTLWGNLILMLLLAAVLIWIRYYAARQAIRRREERLWNMY